MARSTENVVLPQKILRTAGDIEGLPFLEAIRQLRKDVGRENTLYVHVTLLPYLAASKELKTKPTQHSVRELRGIGIQPDVIILRSDFPVGNEVTEKIALACDVESQAVIPLVTAESIYEVPLRLEEAGLADWLVDHFGLTVTQDAKLGLADWRHFVADLLRHKPALRIGLVGKYIELEDAYMSVKEFVIHATQTAGWGVEVVWISSEELEKGRDLNQLAGLDGIVVPGGFGYRGIEGKITAARYARENRIPYLGLCLGMQVLCIELARHIYRSDEPNSTEFDINSKYPIIDLMPDQRDLADMGGTMRLGIYPCQLTPGTVAHTAYADLGFGDLVQERHRHRFEFNNSYRAVMQEAGLVLSGQSSDGRLVEIAELAGHPFMLGSQFHPEFKSRPNRPHPLFAAFMAAAVARQEEERQITQI